MAINFVKSIPEGNMKRSDMIAALVGYLIDYKEFNDVKYDAVALAKFVLACVEKRGMQPPEIKRNLTPEEAVAKGLSTDDVVFEHAWERE